PDPVPGPFGGAPPGPHPPHLRNPPRRARRARLVLHPHGPGRAALLGPDARPPRLLAEPEGLPAVLRLPARDRDGLLVEPPLPVRGVGRPRALPAPEGTPRGALAPVPRGD